jgi:hypothetical protein
MKSLDLSLAEEPLDVNQFKLLKAENYPVLCAGVPIKNKYDQDRINFKDSSLQENVFQVIYDRGNINCFCLKSILLNIHNTYKPLLEQLRSKPHIKFKEYKNLLEEFNLSCDESFGFFNPSVYPIDGKHILKISTNNISETDLYSKILDTETINPMQSFGYFSLFILTHNPFITDEIKKEFCNSSGAALE